ncbi:Transposable element Tc1 transposase [Araneus ventricosus]|uniref:Transposable element Tc1 transposase n=1 Tax=Araneus ventricosus TaxID=182803 RepID=A0A4Y2LQK0_ARAVE|nr:Transposable element Tc1 transposase [Araneus ventricosus]
MNHDFHARVARKKPFISEVNQKERLKFDRCYLKKPKEFWESVIFVDESKFNAFGSNGRQKVWTRPNTELKLRNLCATVKHGGGSQLVWGSMSSFGTGNLQLIDIKVNKYGYLDIRKGNIRQSAQKMGILANFKLYQDNDTKHSSHICIYGLSIIVLWSLKGQPKVPTIIL